MRHPAYTHVILSTRGKGRPKALPVADAETILSRDEDRFDAHLSIARYTPELVEHVESGNGKLKGYAGCCYPDYLPFDIDRGEHGHVVALRDAQQLAITLHERYGIREDQLRYFYSGSKGFHVLVPMVLAGDVTPSPLMPQILRRMAITIAEAAGVDVDQAIYRRLGTIRAAETQHPRTQRWKTEFTWFEFSTWTAKKLVEAASGRDSRPFAWQPHDLEPSDALGELYARCALDAEDFEARPRPEPTRQREGPVDVATAVEVVRPFYIPGHRHPVSTALAGYLVKQGVRQEDAEAIVHAVASGDEDGGEKSLGRVVGTYAAYADGVDVRGWSGLRDELTEEALAELARLVEPTRTAPAAAEEGEGVRLEDFWAYMPPHSYMFSPSRELWPAASVNARLPDVLVENGKPVKPSAWLDQFQAVEQMTWWPGEPMIIEDRLISQGGWIHRAGVRVFNQYRPPVVELGDPAKAGPWIDHVDRVFPEGAAHLIAWLAHRVQRPGEKINHALVLIGPQGVGKDTIIQGAIPAIGPWNVQEVSPNQLMARFNSFLKSTVLRVSEARDLGDADRYRLYEHLKTYTAAPPDVLRCDEKNIREYMIPNVCGVVITSNHTDGVYLPADDRRHYVAATELTKTDFSEDYWNSIYAWFEEGGYEHVAAYLTHVDISHFNPKAPPPKTAAFWAVVDAGRAPEDAELADVLDRLMNPEAVTLGELAELADPSFGEWLRDRRNSRQIPHRMEQVDYVAVRNDAAKDGKWKVAGRRQVIYARRNLSIRDRIAAARRLVESAR